jgi:hypothetical protein
MIRLHPAVRARLQEVVGSVPDPNSQAFTEMVTQLNQDHPDLALLVSFGIDAEPGVTPYEHQARSALRRERLRHFLERLFFSPTHAGDHAVNKRKVLLVIVGLLALTLPLAFVTQRFSLASRGINTDLPSSESLAAAEPPATFVVAMEATDLAEASDPPAPAQVALPVARPLPPPVAPSAVEMPRPVVAPPTPTQEGTTRSAAVQLFSPSLTVHHAPPPLSSALSLYQAQAAPPLLVTTTTALPTGPLTVAQRDPTTATLQVSNSLFEEPGGISVQLDDTPKQAMSINTTPTSPTLPIYIATTELEPNAPPATTVPSTTASPPSMLLAPGSRIPARLAVGIAVTAGSTAPVVAETPADPPWCETTPCPVLTWLGNARLEGANRISVTFDRVMMAGTLVPIQAVALADDATPGLIAGLRDVQPTLAQDVLRAAAGGVSDYLAALSRRQRVTVGDGMTIIDQSTPPLSAFVGGRFADLFRLPSGQSAVIRLAEIPAGTALTVLYGVGQ